MSIKILRDYPAYENYYHFIASTKYRKNAFITEDIRERLEQIISDVVERIDHTELVEETVAYNHIHVLVRSELNPSKTAWLLFGATSRLMRKEFPELKQISETSLWGGKSYEPIKDEYHLRNCISYIKRHLPDNTKV